jgi:hypothetical protein
MAQAPRQTGGEAAADFIRQIVSDPKNVPDVMLLTGYLGASSEEGHDRLYLSPDLTNYAEIPKGAILHQAALPAEQDAHGGVTLWVKKDAALQYKMAPAAQALANYFAGAIQAGAQGAAPAAQPMPATLGGPVCGVTLPNVCQVASAACTVFEPGCRTRQATCFVDCTVLGPACQSHFHTCAPCQLTQRTPCQGASCGVDCTVIFCPTLHAPCPTQQHTPCPGVSCGIDCTVFGPACQSIHVGTCFVQCNPTHGQPQCPFPTEVTCNPVCHRTFAQPCVASPAPACGPNVTIGGCSVACLPGQFPGQPGPVAQAALARGVAPAAQQITFGGPACGGTVGNFCTVFGPCDLWTTDTICCPIGNWTFNCPPTPVNPCVTQHPLQCTLACTRPPQCIVETVNALCVTRNLLHCSVVCTQPGQCLQSVNHCVTVFATCVTCNPAFCQIGPGQVPPGTPVEQRQAFVSAGPDCSIAGNCTRFTPCLI